MSKVKDPKKVAAGRKGGKKSSTNFKRNRALARKAGRRSAEKRMATRLEDFKLEYEDIPIRLPNGLKLSRRASRKIKKGGSILDE